MKCFILSFLFIFPLYFQGNSQELEPQGLPQHHVLTGANVMFGFLGEEHILSPSLYFSLSGRHKISYHTEFSFGYSSIYDAVIVAGIFGKLKIKERVYFYLGPSVDKFVGGETFINPRVGFQFGEKILVNVDFNGFLDPDEFRAITGGMAIKGGVSIPIVKW